MAQEFKVKGPDEGQRDLVLLAVFVGILLLEGPQHRRQLLRGGGHIQLEGAEPLPVDPHAVLHGLLDDGGQGCDAAVRQGDGLFIRRVLRQDGAEVGAVLRQIGLQIHQHAPLPQGQAIAAGQLGLEQHVRQIGAVRLHGGLGLFPVLRLGVLLIGEMNPRQLLHAGEKLVGAPRAVRVGLVVARHGIFRQRGAGNQHRRQDAQQTLEQKNTPLTM